MTDLDLERQVFEDYKSKYLDIYDKTEGDKPDDAASIINEADFARELIQRDEINVAYILAFLAEAYACNDFWDTQKSDAIVEICATEKRETARFKTMIAQYHFLGTI